MARIMWLRWSVLVAMVSAALAIFPVASLARDLVVGWSGGYYSDYTNEDSIQDDEAWADYYSKHAHVTNGREKQLANGVRWRLVTDQRTGVAMPRIVWMPDIGQMNVANHMLELVQAGAMLFSDQQQAGFLAYLKGIEEGPPRFSTQDAEDYKRHLRFLRRMMPKRVVKQSDVALTYASSHYVGLVDLGLIYTEEGTYVPRIIRGVTLDLDRRRILTMESCPKGSFKSPYVYDPTFRFADLLDICDKVSLDRFEAVVRSAEARTKTALASRKDAVVERCWDRPIGYDQEFVLYLAVDGLAVHLTRFQSNADEGSCPLTLNAGNPLIVPYGDLASLMKPGSLRDELLKAP